MNNKAKNVIIRIFAGLICLWFAGIFLLFLFQKVFLLPAVNTLDHPVGELELQEAAMGSGDIYLLGLAMKFPPEGLTARSATPFFNSHRVEWVSVFLAREDGYAGNVIISACPDEPQKYGPLALTIGSSMSAVLFPGASAYELLDRIHRVKAADFSWWNALYDARLVYLSYLKVVITPAWYRDGRVYHVKAPHYSGYLAEGRYGEGRDITELTFADKGTLYQIMILDRNSGDFKGLLSTLRAVDAREGENIIRGYSEEAYSRDLVLVSRISNRGTVGDLEELVGLTEKRKKAGERTVKDINPLKAELEYLRRISD